MNVEDVVMVTNCFNKIKIIDMETQKIKASKVFGESFYTVSEYYNERVIMIESNGTTMCIYI